MQLPGFVGDLVSDTKQMRSEKKAVSEPDVKNGAEIEQTPNAGVTEPCGRA